VATPPGEVAKFLREIDKSIRPAHPSKQSRKSAGRGREAAGRDGNSGSRAANGGALAFGPAAKNKPLRPRDITSIGISVMSLFLVTAASDASASTM